jgi:hypothetical protein
MLHVFSSFIILIPSLLRRETFPPEVDDMLPVGSRDKREVTQTDIPSFSVTSSHISCYSSLD